jgi:hypothetical protein
MRGQEDIFGTVIRWTETACDAVSLLKICKKLRSATPAHFKMMCQLFHAGGMSGVEDEED